MDSPLEGVFEITLLPCCPNPSHPRENPETMHGGRGGSPDRVAKWSEEKDPGKRERRNKQKIKTNYTVMEVQLITVPPTPFPLA